MHRIWLSMGILFFTYSFGRTTTKQVFATIFNSSAIASAVAEDLFVLNSFLYWTLSVTTINAGLYASFANRLTYTGTSRHLSWSAGQIDASVVDALQFGFLGGFYDGADRKVGGRFRFG